MAKREKIEGSERSKKTQEFVKKNWPVALAIAGAAGAIGAAVWLTARYLREKKERDKKQEIALEIVENEVGSLSDGTVIMLESGAYLGQITGDEASEAALELSREFDDEEIIGSLEALSFVSKMENGSRR